MPASTAWKEVIAHDEAERFERHAAFLASLQTRHARDGQPARALHAKGNLGVLAELEVPELADELRIGLFARPAKYRALARFSNGAGARQSDRKMDVRGLAVKVFGVEGKKVIPGMEDATTQDFLAIRSSVVPMRNTEEFMAIVRTSSTPLLMPLRLMGALGLRRGLGVIRAALAGFKVPQSPLAATSFYSALPIAFGPYAVQFAFEAREPAAPGAIASADQLGQELAAHLRARPAIYDLRVRFYTDDAATPIEDASVEWNSPWQTVGTLTLPVQDPESPRGKRVAEVVEQLAFDPWHARTEHRPLGDIMRARNVAYRASTQGRKAAPEPRELPSFD
jgi:hypothetical protein